MRRFQVQEVTWAQVEERRQDLEAELNNTRLLLDKECAKYQSATRQHEVRVHSLLYHMLFIRKCDNCVFVSVCVYVWRGWEAGLLRGYVR